MVRAFNHAREVFITLSNTHGGSLLCHHLQAASLRVAEQYVHAFGNIAKQVNERR